MGGSRAGRTPSSEKGKVRAFTEEGERGGIRPTMDEQGVTWSGGGLTRTDRCLCEGGVWGKREGGAREGQCRTVGGRGVACLLPLFMTLDHRLIGVYLSGGHERQVVRVGA